MRPWPWLLRMSDSRGERERGKIPRFFWHRENVLQPLEHTWHRCRCFKKGQWENKKLCVTRKRFLGLRTLEFPNSDLKNSERAIQPRGNQETTTVFPNLSAQEKPRILRYRKMHTTITHPISETHPRVTQALPTPVLQTSCTRWPLTFPH